MTTLSLANARTFLYTHARLIDRRLYETRFCGADARLVVTALKAYQNPDGGFGNALEPDMRATDSQPICGQEALNYLDKIGLLNDPAVMAEILLPLCGWLESVSTADGGIPGILPTAANYPLPGYWSVPETVFADLNPTASITGLLIKAGVLHPWVERASAYCWREIEALDPGGSVAAQFHTLMPVIDFLMYAPDRDRAERNLAKVAEIIRRRGLVEMDPNAGGYVKWPLDWAPTPSHFCRSLFSDETINQFLDILASRQGADGGLPVNFDSLSPGVAAEWRAKFLVDALITLKEYQRI